MTTSGGDQFYTGIGSRETPRDMLAFMTKIALQLSEEGIILRSGHAAGADQAFEKGCNGWSEIYLPFPGFENGVPINGTMVEEPTDEAYAMGEEIHPNWELLDDRGKALHARNCHQVLGYDLETPSSFLVCWTPGGGLRGGTAQAIRIAKKHKIKIYNLAKSRDFSAAAARWL